MLPTLLLLANFLALTLAAPTFHAAKDTAWQYGTGGGIIGFIIFILDVIVIGRTFPSLPHTLCADTVMF